MTTAVDENFHGSSRSALSENCGPQSEKGSTTEGAVESDSDAYQHSLWRIALYYIYIEMTPTQVESHINLQRHICEELGLKGRIRVSQEGINGVLSGKYEVLQIYEKIISCGLQKVLKGGEGDLVCSSNKTASDKKEEEGNGDTIVDLDVKYCELRADLSVQKQLFDRLIVKSTKNVIGLFNQSIGHEQQQKQKKLLQSEKLRRRRERKRQEQEAKRQTKFDDQHQPQAQAHAQQSNSATTSIGSPHDKILTEKDGGEIVNKENAQSASESLDMSSLYRSVMEVPLKPAKHLSGTEWNEKLDAVASSNKSALLLDARNVYEMKVGHFVHSSTPTLLTNTRKYSDLPQMLASNKEMQERDQIFMYCTGGVRCERVSMLVRELYPNKEIFQLHGGIQRYLETSSKQKKEQQKHQKDSNVDSTNNKNPGYFVGKNFVSVRRSYYVEQQTGRNNAR